MIRSLLSICVLSAVSSAAFANGAPQAGLPTLTAQQGTKREWRMPSGNRIITDRVNGAVVVDSRTHRVTTRFVHRDDQRALERKPTDLTSSLRTDTRRIGPAPQPVLLKHNSVATNYDRVLYRAVDKGLHEAYVNKATGHVSEKLPADAVIPVRTRAQGD